MKREAKNHEKLNHSPLTFIAPAAGLLMSCIIFRCAKCFRLFSRRKKAVFISVPRGRGNIFRLHFQVYVDQNVSYKNKLNRNLH